MDVQIFKTQVSQGWVELKKYINLLFWIGSGKISFSENISLIVYIKL